MSKPWVILNRRYGEDIRDPSPEQLADAIRELYVEDLSGMTEADYEEHGAGSLRFGSDDGPMYVLEATRGGILRFEQWADQDYEVQLSPTRTMTSAPQALATELFVQLASGDIAAVRGRFAQVP